MTNQTSQNAKQAKTDAKNDTKKDEQLQAKEKDRATKDKEQEELVRQWSCVGGCLPTLVGHTGHFRNVFIFGNVSKTGMPFVPLTEMPFQK